MSKSIGSSVGRGGKNRAEDVVVIQYLLNCVPARRGGPAKELILDGICGVLTTGSITQFQQQALGFGDGRVDAGGQTFGALCGYDPYPNQKLNLPSLSSGGKGGGKHGGTPSSNSWDPFGYNNPAGQNYRKEGYAPSQYEGKSGGGAYDHEGVKGGSQTNWSGSKGGGGQSGGPGGKGGGQEGVKSGSQKTGAGSPLPNQQGQNPTTIGGQGFGGKTGSSPQGGTKSSQGQNGGIVGKF